MSNIEWTEVTWNPTTGCDRVSEGCDRCYAMTLAKRLKGMGQSKYQRDGDPRTSGPGFGLTVHEDVLEQPLRWRKPRVVFVNSMSDLFHDEVPSEFIARVFAVMALTRRHTYQVLTKRPGRMASLLTSGAFAEQVAGAFGWIIEHATGVLPPAEYDQAWVHVTERVYTYEPLPPLPNVWLGTSVENQRWADIRVPLLLRTPAAVRFLSCEPLLGPVDLSPWLACDHPSLDGAEGPMDALGRWPQLWRCAACRSLVADHPDAETPARVVERGIAWIIVGGESGPGARPFDPQWARDLIAQCRTAGVAPFVKQLGSVWARANGADPKGGDWTRWPGDLRVREMPRVAVPA